MKIIQDDGSREYICSCTQCSTRFSFVRNEAELMWADHRNPEDYLLVKCPMCDTTMKVLL